MEKEGFGDDESRSEIAGGTIFFANECGWRKRGSAIQVIGKGWSLAIEVRRGCSNKVILPENNWCE